MLRRAVPALLLALPLGCGTQAEEGPSHGQPGAATSDDGGAYYFEQVRFVNDVLQPTVGGVPSTLSNALPCGVGRAAGASRAVVTGRITDVSPGDAKIWGAEEDSVTYTDDFFDPSVDERNVVITVDPEVVLTGSGAAETPAPVRIRVGVIGGAEPERFMSSIASMDRVVAFVSDLPDGPHQGQFYPILGGAGLGLLGPDSSMAFPGLGQRETKFLDRRVFDDALQRVCG